MGRSTHIAHVWVDDFFVRVERQSDPSLVGVPVIIGGTPASTGRVVACSVEAMACGVHPGVSLAEAAVLCPEAAFRPGQLEPVLEASAIVEEAVRRVAGPLEWCATDEAVLDLAQLERMRARRVAEDVQAAIRDVGHEAAVGIADTRTAARVAARLARPQGVLVVLPGFDARFLAGLDLACLEELDGPALDCLRAAGVQTLAALAGRPAGELAALLGRDANALARRAAGHDQRPVLPTPIPRRVCRVHRFVVTPSESHTVVAARDLAGSAASALRHFGCLAQTLTVRVETTDGLSHSRSEDLEAPTAHSATLEGVAGGLACRVGPGREIRGIALSLGRLARAERQMPLFDGLRATSGRHW
jgi:DNA polymerase IV